MASSKPRVVLFAFVLAFGALMAWNRAEMLFESSPGVRPVHVIGLVAWSATCGAALAGGVHAFVKRRSTWDQVEPPK